MKRRVRSRISIILIVSLFMSMIALPGWQHTAEAAQSAAGSRGVVSIASGFLHSLAVRADGSVVAWGRTYGETNVPSEAQGGVIAVSAGYGHSLALTEDGEVVAWGNNNLGQLNVPDEARSGVVAIAAGDNHSLALKTDGSVIAWGYNYWGQSTVPANAQSGVKAIAAGTGHSVALKADGTVIVWGNNGDGQTIVPTEAQSGVAAIASGANHILALKTDGTLVAWGYNYRGQVTVPAGAQSEVVGVAAGKNFSMARKADGSVIAWGDNTFGQITIPSSAQNGTVALDGGSAHVLALMADGSVVAWGLNSNGQASVPAELSKPVKASGISLGFYHALALKSDGGVVAWGSNDTGQINVPTGAQSDVVAIDAGSEHSLALKSYGTVIAWGESDYGKTTVPTAAQSGVVSIVAGANHSAALKSDGSVVAWGINDAGQTDVPTAAQSGVTAIVSEGNHTLALKADGSVVGWGYNYFGQASVPTEAQSGVVSIAAGLNHSLALKTDGSVVAWGDNRFDLMDVPTAAQSGVVAIAAGFRHSLALKSDGSVISWGDGQTTVPTAAQNGVVAIAAGYHHSLALKSDGSIVSWGESVYGKPDLTAPGNWNLSSMTIAAGAISPNFHPNVTSYTGYVNPSATDVNVTATLASPLYAELQINGSYETSASAVHVPLTGDSTVIQAHVEPYFQTGKTYTVTIVEDATAPTISLGTNGNETLATSASTTVTVSDGESGVDPDTLQYVWTQSSSTPDDGSAWTSFSSGDSLTQNGVNGDWYLHIRAADEVGNVANAGSNRFRLDNGAPVVSFGMNGSETYASSASTTVTVSDGDSGVDPDTLQYVWTQSSSTPDDGFAWTSFSSGDSLTQNGVNGDWYLHIRAADEVGNIANVGSNRFRLDNSAPLIEIELQKQDHSPYASGSWTNQNVTASLSASDELSGIDTLQYSLDNGSMWEPYSAPLSFIDEGAHTLMVRAADRVGNTSSTTRSIHISRSGLVLDVHLKLADDSEYNAGDWVKQSVTASVYTNQTTNGVDVISTTYSLDGGSTWQPYSAPVSFSNEGQHTLDVKTADSADNELTSSYIIRVDSTVPVAGLGTNGNETYEATASTTVNVSDNDSGIDTGTLQYVWTDEATMPGDAVAWTGFASGDVLSLSGVDGDWYLHIRAADTAGNAMEDVSNRFRLDNSAPAVVFDTNGNESFATSASTVVTVSDSYSGVNPDSLQYAWTQSPSTPDSGAAWTGFVNGDTLSLSGVDGDWYLHIQAADAAGSTVDSGSNRFLLDNSAPAIVFDTNGNEENATRASTTVTISDNDSGVDPSSLQYVWKNSAGVPAGDEEWTSFASGDEMTKSGVNGDWYLHVRGMDRVGHTQQAVSNRFKLFTLVLPIINNQAGLYEDSLLLDSTNNIQKITQGDGTIIEQLSINETALNQALKKLQKDLLTIRVDDTEGIVQVQLPASSLVSAMQSKPNLSIHVELNGASYQLAIPALHWEQIAETLGVELEDMKLTIKLEKLDPDTEAEIRQLAADQGMRLVSRVIDFKVTVEADGQSLEISDFGGTYMTRAIVIDEAEDAATLIGVEMVPETKTFRYIPSLPGTRPDGTPEMVMHVPHNSLYAVVEPTGKSFGDLTDHWAKAEVELLATKRIVEGAAPDRFAPNANITRAEFTALLVRALGLSTVQSDASDTGFADMSSDAWYAPAATAAVKAGLIQGYADNSFRPHQPIRREELAVLIDRARHFVNGQAAQADASQTLNAFEDQASISDWAGQAVANLVQDGIVQGRNEHRFEPKAHTTRAEAVVLLARLLRDLNFIAE
ncbi:S-layer homology domain-containing protein [Paenibacillus sp. J5C_2022]|uniref:S-layer homology domain-containing protein n=1 Tax=Paenibacillus sp. J5C2022 TaxID=2977129 RepID=UPI0021CF7313|nr:S-layer homology domain-containing protein [Paenibacillus sp. J5C2022]MCU6708096.1 S-layer homology domain-containing protein [Paenibacillus sp. J5C2022]